MSTEPTVHDLVHALVRNAIQEMPLLTRIAAENQATSDLCLPAAQRALEDANIPADKIGLIIVATLTPELPVPVA